MRKILLTLHLYLALAAGAFIFILGITGAIMAFEPEIDHLLHWKLTYIKPGPRALSLAEIGSAVTRKFPGEKIAAYLLSPEPGISYQVATRSGLVSVNQYTGDILGMRPPGMDFLGYVHQIHLRLALRDKGDSGGKIMSWVGVAVLLLLVSGLYLWWPVKRASVKFGASSRRVWFDLHNTIGIFSLAFLLILSVTGIMIGFERQTVPLLYKITGSHPSARPLPPPPAPAGAVPIGPDRAVEIAKQTLPGAAPWVIFMPPGGKVYQVSSRFPEDRTPGGRSRIMIDAYTGKVLMAEGSRTAPAGARLVILNRAIHTGDLFGIPTKILVSLASFLMAIQVVSGVAIWWKRLKSKRSNVPTLEKTAA